MPASGGGRPVMEVSMVAWVWSLRPLPKPAMELPLYKLVASQTPDQDLGFMAYPLGKTLVGVPGTSSPALSPVVVAR
jgi:hypothetical protein